MNTLRRIVLPLPVLVGLTIGCAPAQTRGAPGSGGVVTSQDLKDANEPIESIIQKKVPGVLVTRTGDGGIALQIRGASSHDGRDTPPLYVLNGLPFHPGSGGALTGINPHDIETVKVLKGAEAGMYGIDGANGVIVITTKSAGTRRP